MDNDICMGVKCPSVCVGKKSERFVPRLVTFGRLKSSNVSICLREVSNPSSDGVAMDLSSPDVGPNPSSRVTVCLSKLPAFSLELCSSVHGVMEGSEVVDEQTGSD